MASQDARHPWPDPAVPARWPVAIAIGLAVAAFHFFRGIPLAGTVLMQSFNWVFDYDSSRYVAGWCGHTAPVVDHIATYFVARHPLSLVARPMCLALGPLFDTPETALMALTALCAGLCAALAYLLAACYCRAEFDRLLLALGFALSAQPLLLGVIPETYGFAMAGVGYTLWCLSRAPQADKALLTGRSAAWSLFLNLGITLTNSALNVLGAAVMGWQRVAWRPWLRLTLQLWLVSGLAVLLVLGISAVVYAPELVGDALAAPRHLWWAINIHRGEPATLLTVIATFLVYNVAAPVTDFIYLPPPDGHLMAEFRSFRFGPLGTVTAALWCFALAYGTWAGWRQPVWRRLLAVAGLWLAFNVVLHWYWQFRGSIFIYGGHSMFALHLLAAMGYGHALRQFPATAVRAMAVLLVLLLAVNNLASYDGVIDFLVRSTPPP